MLDKSLPYYPMVMRMDGEQVARTEEQAEQHACHHNIFFQGQVTFHMF